MGESTAIWSDLADRLDHIMCATADMDGAWTLSLCKHEGGPVTADVCRGWAGGSHLHDTSHISHTLDFLATCCVEQESSEMGMWQMECGSRWTPWRPEGVHFAGLPGEIVCFRFGGFDYRATFGPSHGEGWQENLQSGRQRRLRLLTGKEGCTTEVRGEDAVQQLCEMGFVRSEVLRCLHAARGNPSRAVQLLAAGAARGSADGPARM